MILKRTLCFSGFVALFCILIPKGISGQSLQLVNSFGSDPGNLKMYEYEPSSPPQGDAPLVMVLHGCGQTANGYFNATEWQRLADRYGFYLVFPEQRSSNNSASCFNWFLSWDQERGGGEPKSLRQMVGQMKTDHAIDDEAVYVTGLSAGGAMSSVMMACYPDLFDAGAVMAGVPYKAASSYSRAQKAMSGKVDSTPSEWETIAKGGNPSFSGSYPRLATFHGTSDGTVDPVNARELMEQWTALHGADQNVDHTENAFDGVASVTLEEYRTANGSLSVARYTIDGMGHGISVDPGSPVCEGKGGSTGSASFDKDFFSSYWAARFFGIVPTGCTSIAERGELPERVRFIGPNPSEEGFRLKLSEKSQQAVRLELYDASGKRCRLSQKQLAPGERLHFGEELSPGLYLLRAGKGSHPLIVR